MNSNQSPTPKKKNKKLIIIVVVSVALILCFCSIFFIPTTPSDEEKAATETENAVVAASLTTGTLDSTLPSASKSPESTATITTTPTPVYEASFNGNGNVRTGPGLNYPIAKVMKSGDTVQVFGRSEDNTWLWIDSIEQLWVHISVAEPNVPVQSIPLAPTPVPTRTPTLTRTPTPIPTATLVPAISLDLIYENLEEMTELQFKDYKNSIVGKPVREYVKIGNVSDDGRVSLSGAWTPFLFNYADFGVVVVGVPYDVAIELNDGDVVYLEATIDRIVGDNNYYYNRENVLVLVYKNIEQP